MAISPPFPSHVCDFNAKKSSNTFILFYISAIFAISLSQLGQFLALGQLCGGKHVNVLISPILGAPLMGLGVKPLRAGSWLLLLGGTGKGTM